MKTFFFDVFKSCLMLYICFKPSYAADSYFITNMFLLAVTPSVITVWRQPQTTYNNNKDK